MICQPTPSYAMAFVEQELPLVDLEIDSEGNESGGGGTREVVVGTTRYRLARPLRFNYVWTGCGWTCWEPQTAGLYVGSGRTQAHAAALWREALHADFQHLYGMRPFEMNARDRTRWSRLCCIIDVSTYRERAPLVLRTIGQVRWDKLQRPSSIVWLDGRKDRIRLNQCPADFAGCKSGQWIEAVAEYSPRSHRLLSIRSYQRIPSIHNWTEQTRAVYVRNLRAAVLPASTDDWLAPESQQHGEADS